MSYPSFLIALGVLSASIAGFSATANASSGDIACGVSTTTAHGMMTVEGILQTPEALTGQYRFSLKSSGNGGSTNINQGGNFTAAPGTDLSLGRVMVNAGSHIDVDFTIDAGGQTYDCSQKIARST